MTASEHVTVLLKEAVDLLAVRSDGLYVDCTFGRGGHSRRILSMLGEKGRLLALDRDPEAEKAALEIADPRFAFVRSPFSQLKSIVQSRELAGRVDGILFDLGVSSPQLDDPSRGFSFSHDGPLDMRMDPTSGVSAADWLNSAGEDEIAWVLKEFGEERFARKIARAVVSDRREHPFTRTGELAGLISRVVKTRESHKHPATRSFQAVRIYVNSELDEIRQALGAAVEALAPGGRLAVISFHSLEDRLVKQFIRRESALPELPPGLPLTDRQLQDDRRLEPAGKAVKPSEEEMTSNPRSRSAVLRGAVRRGYDL